MLSCNTVIIVAVLCTISTVLIKTFNVNLGEHLLYEFFKGNASSRQKVDNVS